MYRISRPAKGCGVWLAGCIVSFCGFTGGLNIVWVTIIIPKIRRQEVNFTLNELEQSCVASFIHIGQLVSTVPSGYLQNAFGRRCVLLITIPLQLIAWVIIYFLQYFWAILLARVLMGLWIGFLITCVPTYVAEISKSAVRGRITSQLPIMALFGFLFQSTLGTFLSYETVALTTFSISFCLFLALLNIPESVYSLLRSRKVEKAKQALQWFRGTEDVNEELAAIQRSVEIQMTRSHGFLEIFRWPASRRAFIQAASLVLVQRFSGFLALSAFVSIAVPSSWLSADHYPILWTATNLIFVTLAVICVDHVDHKIMLITSTMGCAIFAFVISTWFFLDEKTNIDMTSTLWLPMTCLTLHAVFYSMGLSYLPIVFQGEVFPINIKAKAASSIAFLGFVMSVIVVQIFIPLEIYVGRYSNFLFYSIASGVGVIVCSKLVETRNKSLDYIQQILEGKA